MYVEMKWLRAWGPYRMGQIVSVKDPNNEATPGLGYGIAATHVAAGRAEFLEKPKVEPKPQPKPAPKPEPKPIEVKKEPETPEEVTEEKSADHHGRKRRDPRTRRSETVSEDTGLDQ